MPSLRPKPRGMFRTLGLIVLAGVAAWIVNPSPAPATPHVPTVTLAATMDLSVDPGANVDPDFTDADFQRADDPTLGQARGGAHFDEEDMVITLLLVLGVVVIIAVLV